MNIITEYPIIDNGKVIQNGSRCGEKCSSEIPFLYQEGEYANVSGKKKPEGYVGGEGTYHPKKYRKFGNRYSDIVQNPVIIKSEKYKVEMSNATKIALAFSVGIAIVYMIKKNS